MNVALVNYAWIVGSVLMTEFDVKFKSVNVVSTSSREYYGSTENNLAFTNDVLNIVMLSAMSCR